MTPRAAALLLAACLGCAGDVEVREGHLPDYDFGRLRTYAWLEREPTGDPRIDERLLDERVRGGVDSQLAEKGYRLAPSGEADFLVGYRAVLGRERTVESSEPRFEGIWTEDYAPRGAAAEGASLDKVEYEGTLVLLIHDGKRRQLVWRAAAETEIQPRSSALSSVRDERIRRTIRGMLARFPP
jgi:hypothetical protein